MLKRIIAIVLIVSTFAGCRKNLTDLNLDPKNPSEAPSYALFTNAQRNLADILASPDVNSNVFRLLVQHWVETQYTDETNYDLYTRAIPDRLWGILYRDILTDLRRSRDLIPVEVTDPARQKNQLAIEDIMEVYTFSILVTTFGDVPYSQALNPDITFPKYDDAQTIWDDLLKRLDADIAALNPSAGSFASGELIYNGDISSWKKFAASLKLRMGMVLADVSPAKAKAAVESAVATGVFTSNADNAVFNYYSATPNTNPIWSDLVQSQRNDFVPAETIVDTMNALNDPRRPFYFETTAGGAYVGGEVGVGNDYPSLSHVSDKIKAPDFPVLFLSYSEIEFLLAEAKERGYNVGAATAEQHYNNAVTASIKEWGGTDAQAAAYLAQPSVDYSTAGGSYKEKIGLQMWISLYNRGYEAWLQQRRYDAPVLEEPATALTGYPVRFPYPVEEQNLNTTNYTNASDAIGGDDAETKLWFDKF